MVTPVPPVSVFLASFPEFSKAPSSLVNAKLGEAARRTFPDVFADAATAQDALLLQAAILLSMSPYARQMKLVDDSAALMWQLQLFELQRTATQGLRIF